MTGGVPTIGVACGGKLHSGCKSKNIDGSSPRTITHFAAATTKVGEGVVFIPGKAEVTRNYPPSANNNEDKLMNPNLGTK